MSNERPLSPQALSRIKGAVARAEETLGGVEEASRWLSEPNQALGGQRPMDLLDTDEGTIAVERALGRAGGGVYGEARRDSPAPPSA